MRENFINETVGPAKAKYERQTFLGRTITENQGMREGSVRSCYPSFTVQNITARIIKEAGIGFKYKDVVLNYYKQMTL